LPGPFYTLRASLSFPNLSHKVVHFCAFEGIAKFVIKEFAWLGHALYNCCIVISAKKKAVSYA